MRKTFSLGLVAILAAMAVPAYADPGDSGVVNGADVQQFFGSGFIPDPQQMEEASIPFDKAINIPWSRKRIPLQQPQQQVQSQDASGSSASGQQTAVNQSNQQSKQKKKKKGFFGTVGGAFAATANFIGFPVGEDNDPDATLASDLALPAQQVEDEKTVRRQMKLEEKQEKQNKNQGQN